MNAGFSKTQLDKFRQKLAAAGRSYLEVDPEENNDEFVHCMFIGKHEGREAIFDAIIYTLRLQHETEIYDLAISEAIKQFPEHEKFIALAGEGESPSKAIEEEIAMFIADTIVGLEEDGEVMVCEHVNLDTDAAFGIGMEAGLRAVRITKAIIEKLIKEINDDTLLLDETMISYQTGEDED